VPHSEGSVILKEALELAVALVKQPYSAVTLIAGVLLVVFPSITIDKDYNFSTHAPTTIIPVAAGLSLILFSGIVFYIFQIHERRRAHDVGSGVDLRHVKEGDSAFWTTVNGCEIRVAYGRIETYAVKGGTAIVLPCNEYFDDKCVDDTRSALGAYVHQAFDGQITDFVSLIKSECTKRLGPGFDQQKTSTERAKSFGPGKCVLLLQPLGRSVPVALVSTTTQRAGEGLVARISYLFSGMRELMLCLSDTRISEIVMPVLGAGHGGIHAPLALVGLLLAVAEAARYGQGARRLNRVTIVVFRKDAEQEVEEAVARRALALIASQD
jgi:hypothetical protein